MVCGMQRPIALGDSLAVIPGLSHTSLVFFKAAEIKLVTVKQKRGYRRHRHPELGLAQIQHVLSSPPKQFRLQTSPMPISPSYRAKVRCKIWSNKRFSPTLYLGDLCRVSLGYFCPQKIHQQSHTHLLDNSKLHLQAYLFPQVRFFLICGRTQL